jgi:uncharacterized protein (TIGR00255 family)
VLEVDLMSMTGFGRGSAPFGGGSLVVELRTVNHRFLEVRSRAPRELLAAEPLIEKLLRATIHRGHCTVHVSCEGPGGGASRIDERTLEAYLEQLIAVAARHGLCLADLVPVLSAAPDLFALPADLIPAEVETAVTAAFAAASQQLLAMRRSEGQAMAAALGALLAETGAAVERLAGLAAGCAGAILDRSRERIALLLADTEIAMDPRRIEAEAALLADRADVNEEVTRLRSHCRQMEQLLVADKPVGRSLEFLIQEMGREANTLGAKAALGELTHQVVELKALLEKQRELALNVE